MICLNVDEELSSLHCLNDGNPGDGHSDENEKENPTDDQQLLRRGRGPDLLVDVHREQGRGGVEDGGEVGHEGSQHDRQHHAPEPLRHDAKDESGEGGVAAGHGVAAHLLADRWVDAADCVRIEHPADHSRHHDQEHRQHLWNSILKKKTSYKSRTLIQPVKMVAP